MQAKTKTHMVKEGNRFVIESLTNEAFDHVEDQEKRIFLKEAVKTCIAFYKKSAYCAVQLSEKVKTALAETERLLVFLNEFIKNSSQGQKGTGKVEHNANNFADLSEQTNVIKDFIKNELDEKYNLFKSTLGNRVAEIKTKGKNNADLMAQVRDVELLLKQEEFEDIENKLQGLENRLFVSSTTEDCKQLLEDVEKNDFNFNGKITKMKELLDKKPEFNSEDFQKLQALYREIFDEYSNALEGSKPNTPKEQEQGLPKSSSSMLNKMLERFIATYDKPLQGDDLKLLEDAKQLSNSILMKLKGKKNNPTENETRLKRLKDTLDTYMYDWSKNDKNSGYEMHKKRLNNWYLNTKKKYDELYSTDSPAGEVPPVIVTEEIKPAEENKGKPISELINQLIDEEGKKTCAEAWEFRNSVLELNNTQHWRLKLDAILTSIKSYANDPSDQNLRNVTKVLDGLKKERESLSEPTNNDDEPVNEQIEIEAEHDSAIRLRIQKSLQKTNIHESLQLAILSSESILDLQDAFEEISVLNNLELPLKTLLFDWLSLYIERTPIKPRIIKLLEETMVRNVSKQAILSTKTKDELKTVFSEISKLKELEEDKKSLLFNGLILVLKID